MVRGWGIVAAGFVTAILGSADTGRAQPPEAPAVRQATSPAGPAFVDPRGMVLDGPRDHASHVTRALHAVQAEFTEPRSRRDARFFPVAVLFAFPFAFAFVRVLENVVVRRRHGRLAPETDIARRVSLVVDAKTRRALEAAIHARENSAGAEGGRSADESRFVRIIGALSGIAEVATYASLETTVDTPSNAAMLVARWHEELTETYQSQSMEMHAGDASAAEDAAASGDEDGFAVLSLLLHAGGSLPFPPSRIDRTTIPALLASLIGERGFLEQFQLVWSPPEPNETLDASELASAHPDLVSLDVQSPNDQQACRFCTARFSVELTTCPQCGATQDANDDASALDETIHVEDVECRQCKVMFPSHRYRCPACGAHRFTESGKPPPVERASVPPPDGSGRGSVPPPSRKSVPPSLVRASTPPPADRTSTPPRES